jgi:hypothetical protein
MPESDFSNAATGRIRRVISVCEKRDIDVWKIASRAVARHIPADEFHLLCPDSQVGEFAAVTHKAWKILGESSYSENCGLVMIRERVSGANRGRENWLFQQFLKINAALMSGLGDDEVMLIWDADTIPMKRLTFSNSERGCLLCYAGREVHAPYFETMGRLLGFGKVCAPSFIAQCLPLRVGWVRGMVREIEQRHGIPYTEAVLSVLPGVSGSEFSEYETIGNWVATRFPGALEFRESGRWLRDGRFFAGAASGSFRGGCAFALLRPFFDYAAMEKWGGRSIARRLAGRISRFVRGHG